MPSVLCPSQSPTGSKSITPARALDELGLGPEAGTLRDPHPGLGHRGPHRRATAFTWYQESGPSLFASDARRAVYVTGALTRQESIAFAEGLQPVPANADR